MPNVEIEDHHNVARYCKFTTIRNGLPSPEAFYLRGNEDYLSVQFVTS